MPLLTIKQVMTELGIKSDTTIHEYRKTGTLKFVDIRPNGAARAVWRCDSREVERVKAMGTDTKQPTSGQPNPPSSAFRSRSGRRTAIR